MTVNLVIAAQRRGRNGYGSRKRQRQVIPQPQPSQSTSEEESTDGGSVTRCVCGESRKCELEDKGEREYILTWGGESI